jgi:hypothetical protein
LRCFEPLLKTAPAYFETLVREEGLTTYDLFIRFGYKYLFSQSNVLGIIFSSMICGPSFAPKA